MNTIDYMKKTLFFLLHLVVFTSLSDQAKAQDDNLKPVNGIFSQYDFQFDYYSLVRKLLFRGFSDNPEIRFVVIPSFTPEFVLDIEVDNNKKYFLLYHQANPSIWYNQGKKKINIDSMKTEIEYKSFALIKKLFLAAINKTKYQPDSLHSIGIDGTDYYFSVNDMGQKDGFIWSPPVGTKMNRLVEIAIHLTQLMKEEPDMIEFDTTFSKEIEDLTKLLE
jgi:hypothetical protein